MSQHSPAAATSLPASETAKPAATAHILDVNEPEKPLPLPEMLKVASTRYGKSLTTLVREIASLGFGPGKVSAEEYFDLRLFDDAGLTSDDKRAFAGMRACKQIGLDANRNEHWFAVVSDKLTFYTIVNGYGLPTIRQKAFYHPVQNYPALGMLRNEAALGAFLRNPANLPLFGKPCAASLSLGTIAVEGYDPGADSLILSGDRRIPVDAVVADIVSHYRTGYMLQEKLVPHPALRELCGNRIGTIRVYTMFGEKGPEVFRSCWKVPAGTNMADNFWRKGNMLAALEQQTGRIQRVIRGAGLNQVEVESHPDTGARLAGAAIPGWSDILDLARWACRVMHHVPFIGWDIAMTDRGPVLVEANNTPDLRLVQMAERRGAYDEQLKAFVALCGARYEKAEARFSERLRGIRSKSINRVFASLKG